MHTLNGRMLVLHACAHIADPFQVTVTVHAKQLEQLTGTEADGAVVETTVTPSP